MRLELNVLHGEAIDVEAHEMQEGRKIRRVLVHVEHLVDEM